MAIGAEAGVAGARSPWMAIGAEAGVGWSTTKVVAFLLAASSAGSARCVVVVCSTRPSPTVFDLSANGRAPVAVPAAKFATIDRVPVSGADPCAALASTAVSVCWPAGVELGIVATAVKFPSVSTVPLPTWSVGAKPSRYSVTSLLPCAPVVTWSGSLRAEQAVDRLRLAWRAARDGLVPLALLDGSQRRVRAERAAFDVVRRVQAGVDGRFDLLGDARAVLALQAAPQTAEVLAEGTAKELPQGRFRPQLELGGQGVDQPGGRGGEVDILGRAISIRVRQVDLDRTGNIRRLGGQAAIGPGGPDRTAQQQGHQGQVQGGAARAGHRQRRKNGVHEVVLPSGQRQLRAAARARSRTRKWGT